MLKSLNRWYQDWRDEQMAVLLDPHVAENVSGYLRRCSAKKLAKLSAIERAQLHAFCVKYQGRTLWVAILQLSFLFTIAGLALQLIRPKNQLWELIVAANVLGWAFMLVLMGMQFNYRQIMQRPWRTALRAVGGVSVGLVFGFVIGSLVRGKDLGEMVIQDGPLILKVALVIGLAHLMTLGVVALWRNKAYETIAVQLALDAEKEKSARQESESQLRMLRAQIEPHFLFNTLGAVQTLAEQGGARKAAELTANLIVFLRACMHEMRSERISLREEFAMVRAYLEVMQARMGGRLGFSLELPEAWAQVCVPSMLILSLVENAIKHGLEPSLSGGEVRIAAWCDAGVMQVQVTDTGVGLSDQPGNGIGLQNVRERLHWMYGAGSSLTISEVDGGGVQASIYFPLKEI